MKLKELNDAIAAACDVRGNVVTAVQNETFRQIAAQLEKGEKVIIPDFGMFVVKDVPAAGDEPAKKTIRFRLKSGDDEKKKEGRKNKNKGAEDASTGDDE
jgi:nucleoid DNA-binding protein